MNKLYLFAVLALILSVVTFVLPAYATDNGMKPQFATDTILVKFQDGVNSDDQQVIHQRHGGVVVGEIPEINVEIVKVPAGQAVNKAAEYKTEKSIEYAELDGIYRTAGVPNDPYYATWQWNLMRISASQAWDITTGSASIKVAVLDSGIDATQPDLQGKVVGSVNYSTSSTINDIYGHGTHVAGIVAANTNNGIGVAGLGYNTSLLNVKVINDVGIASGGSITQGIIWAADNGANVINMNVASNSYSAAMENAVNYAWGKGVVLAAPAGNDGNTIPVYPAAYTNVIAVAATDDTDWLLPFSSTGDWVDVAAPGATVWSTLPGNQYGGLAGTCVSSPHVAGLAALVFTRVTDTNGDGRLNDEVRSAIENNCDNINVTGIGHGRINAYKAVLNAGGQVTTGTISGTVTDSSTAVAISGATVTAGSYSATTNSSGAYTISNVPAGSYTVTASATGYTSQSKSATVTAGLNTALDFALTHSSTPESMWVSKISGSFTKNSLKVTVAVTSSTRALSGAQVTLLVTCSNGSQWNLQGTTNRKGTVTLAIYKPPAGTYTVDVTDLSAAGYTWDTNQGIATISLTH